MNPELSGSAVEGYSLCGMLTHDTVPDLFKGRLPEFAEPTQLNLGGLERVDSAGLALLVEWSATARSQGKKLMLYNVPAPLQALINVSGLRDVLSISE